ncbi:charged multivesicular body protein 7, partial [Tremellales sp. Uapishka_1]
MSTSLHETLDIPRPSGLRLASLYSTNSSQRNSNPDGYESNVKWWTHVLERFLVTGASSSKDKLVLTVDEALVDALRGEKGERLKGLGGIVESLGTRISPLKDFTSSTVPIHSPPSLGSRLIARPLWWVFAQINPFASAEVEKEDVLWKRYGEGRAYVYLSLVEAAADHFEAQLESNPLLSFSSSIFDIPAFHAEFFADYSKKDVEVIVHWLSRDKGVIVTDGTIIKILEPGQRVADHPISQADRGVVSIKAALKRIDEQITDIETQAAESQQKAKKHLALNQKTVAMSHLRSRKHLDELLSKRVANDQQLRAVLRSIDQAKGDVEIMEAYATSTLTLKTVLADPRLDLETIHATTDNLAEVMADADEIDRAVRVGGEIAVGAKGDVDDEELEDELEELVKEEKERLRAEELRAEEERRNKEREARDKVEREREAREKAERDTREKDVAMAKETEARVALLAHAEQTQWENNYQAAQLRERQEMERAKADRLRTDESRLAAD